MTGFLSISFLLGSLVAQAQSKALKTDYYEESFSLINLMIVDEMPYSFKNAVISTENAYFAGQLDRVQIEEQIHQLTTLSESLIKGRFLNYFERDKEQVNKWASIFQVFCDTIPLKIDSQSYSYIPFRYDFDDVFGHESRVNLFVSKLLTTRTGNCHSMPYLYKILSEELGVDANLALAPNHIYIKHKNLKNGWYNTELTSRMFPLDAWLMASGYIHIDAVTNGVYMKALSDKESLALVLIDLAENYQDKFPHNDGAFILKCCDWALKVYPNYVNALILKAETHKKIVESQREMDKAIPLFKDLEKEYAHIHELGYRNMPENMYLNWLITLKTEREKYENTNLTKQ